MAGMRRWLALAVALAGIAVVIVAIQLVVRPELPVATVVNSAPASSTVALSATGDESGAPPAADFVGITKWINSEALSLEDLRGRVVLVDFWTYTCINCIRTLPYLRDWNDKYSGRGLTIVGVHSPEFEFEKEESKVREAIARERVTWPVAMDNDFDTWRAYSNRWWPHKYLIDQHGRIRYHHIGEGAYVETETMIRQLLDEAGYDVSDTVVGSSAPQRGTGVPITRELYAGLGWSSGKYLGNREKPKRGETTVYSDPGGHEDGRFYLDGTWVVDSESAKHEPSGAGMDGYVAIHYTAASVNVVAQPPGSGSFEALVTLDGGPVPESHRGSDVKVRANGDTYIEVDSSRLYNLVRSESADTHGLKITVESPDFVLYTFTFSAAELAA